MVVSGTLSLFKVLIMSAGVFETTEHIVFR